MRRSLIWWLKNVRRQEQKEVQQERPQAIRMPAGWSPEVRTDPRPLAMDATLKLKANNYPPTVIPFPLRPPEYTRPVDKVWDEEAARLLRVWADEFMQGYSDSGDEHKEA